MFRSLKSAMLGSIFLTTFFLLATFNYLSAEQGAWGGNGGWWGGGNREWIGDFDGPGYQRSPCNCRSRYCPHPYHYNYCYYNGCYNNCYNPSRSQYYYDASVPGAGVYFNLRRCR